MKNFIVFLSGSYLSVFGAFQLIRLPPRYNFIVAQPEGIYRMFLAVNFVAFSLFGLVSLIMGIGLIFKKMWAKDALIIVSAFALFFGVTVAICMAVMYFVIPFGTIALNAIYDVYYWAYVILCLIAIPTCFLKYFSRLKSL